ncbi:MAG TPA: VTT domain-containing protein [Allosphingosinicella sp.]
MTFGQRRTLILTMAAAAAAAILLLLLSDLVTLEQLKARREELLAIIAAHPFAFTAAFILAFALAASFAPGAAVLKVAAGALFGLWGGFAISLVATLLAATIGFVAARYALRHWVERRFHNRVEIINRGVVREGVVFLLALRLNPLIPFFLINFGMGLTRMRLWVFAATSFFGLIPASFVYANAGTELARIEAPSDILTVRLIGSLILLSLMPLAGRWAAKWLRARRAPVAEQGGGA